MIKTFFTATTFCWLLLNSVSAVAQKNEFSLVAGGGLAGLEYTITNGSASLKPGFHGGLGYTRSFKPRWGIVTGLELASYQTKATLTPNTVFSSYEVDSESNAFEFQVRTKGYEERQQFLALQIPLLLQYQSTADRKALFFSQAGLRFAIPVNSPYHTKAEEIHAAGYYPDVNVEINDLPAHGFGTQTNWNGKGKNDFSVSYALAAEAGLKFRVASRHFLYVSAYMDYGLNNIKKAEGQETLLAYHPTALNQSGANGTFSLANTTGDVRLMAYGVRLRFGLGAKPKKAVAPAIITPVDTPQVVKEQAPKEEVVVPAVPEKITREPEEKARFTVAEDQLLQTALSFGKIGNTVLPASAKAQLDQLAELLERHDNLELLIEGHTCNLGSEAVNQRIGLARAKAVAAYLKGQGIEASRLQAVGKGASEPLVPNTSEANRKQNRRVVFKVSK